LLDNAAKYGPAGQVIRVGLVAREDQVLLTVTDQGPGIPPADLERVFEPFARGASATRVTGAGIGLSVVHDVAVAHGGRAWIENGPSRGVAVHVALPARPSSDAPPGSLESLHGVAP
jgi:signal transduction histidine kinase